MQHNQWPKKIPDLTPAQELAREGWMKYWHEVLPNKFGLIEKFNHGYPVKLGLPHKENGKIKTLEVGAGLGEHFSWEDKTAQDYTMLEYREEWCKLLTTKYPEQKIIHGDIQKKLTFADGHFDRIIAIHVLEHLPDLPKALSEIHRLLAVGGILDIVIPCEGGAMYELARNMTSARMFQKKFGMPYKPIMQAEHINDCDEILGLLKTGWRKQHSTYFPFLVPLWQGNLILGLRLIKV